MPRILLISDDRRARQAWRRGLSTHASAPFEIVEATDDEAALASLQAGAFDGVVLDGAMPAEAVAEVLGALRDRPHAPPLALLEAPQQDVPDALLPDTAERAHRDGLTAAQVHRIALRLARQHELRQQRDEAVRARLEAQQSLATLQAEHARFLADRSHDLRSPLNAVIGYSELLLERLDGDERTDLADDVEKIRTVGWRLLGVVAGMTQGETQAPRRPAAPPAAQAAPAMRGDGTNGDDAPPRTETAGPILIIDDDAELRELMARFLESEGYHVETAASGEEGLALVREHDPIAITLDLHMPGMDGWAVLQALKEDPALARTPVIMLTGRGNERVAARALRQGVDDYLIKGDISALTLHRAVRSVLEKDALRRTVERTQRALLAANDALTHSERRYRLLAEHASDVISRHPADGSYRYASTASSTLFGYEPDELLGRPIFEFIHPDDLDTFEPRFRGIAGGDAAAEAITYRLRTKDGAYRWAETRARRVEHDGEAEVVAVTRDVEERVAAEQALKAFSETLEARVAAQTQQIRTLASSLTLAEQRERSRIAQVLHDDLQQQLYGLNMRTALLRRHGEGLPEPVRRTLDAVETMIADAITMTRNLSMELSPPMLRDPSLEGIMAWLAEHMADLHGLQVDVETRTPCLVPNREMRVLIFQLVRELLFNTVKHAGVDAAVVTLGRDEEALVVTVADAGRGFDVEAPGADDGPRGGWGLGSMEERLGLFDATLDVASAPGEGTRTRIEIPSAALDAA